MFQHQIAEELKTLAEQKSQYRCLHTVTRRDRSCVEKQGRVLLNLSSNDYLGLGSDQRLHDRIYSRDGQRDDQHADLSRFGLGSTSSRLLSGNHPGYDMLESALAERYRREAALVFSSGYHANIGILTSLVGRQDLVVCDRLCHASLLDGIRLSGARLVRYRHNDLQHLSELLQRHSGKHRRTMIVTESVFSMDGDQCDLPGLIDIKKRFETYLMLDEAHAVGVFGPSGLGLAEQLGVTSDVDLLVGTFGKAFAGHGAFLACDQVIREYLINTARPFIFTTALPPVVVHWNRMVLDEMPHLRDRADRLLRTAAMFRQSLQRTGMNLHDAYSSTPSQIVPVILGENNRAIEAARLLQEAGFLAMPVRPPTVPPGTARIRFSLTADITIEQLEPIAAVLARCV